MKARSTLFAGLVVILVAALASSTRAAVEDHVPQSCGFFAKVRSLEEHYSAFKESGLMARLQDPSFAPEFAERMEKAREEIKQFQRAHEVDVGEVLTDILGREVGLAGFADETGVLVAEAEDEGTLREAVREFLRVEQSTDRFNASESSKHGDFVIETVHLKSKTRHHVVMGRVLAVSEEMEALKRVIDVETGTTPPLSNSPDYREALKLVGDPDAFAYVDQSVLGPLATELRQKALRGFGRPHRRGGRKAMFRLCLSEVLPHVRYAVLAPEEGEHPALRLRIIYKEGRRPAKLRRVLPQEGPQSVLGAVPPEAGLAMARSVDPAAAWESAMGMLREAAPMRAHFMEAVLDRLVRVTGGVYSREQFFSELTGQAAMFVTPASEPWAPPALSAVVRLRETSHIPVALESIAAAAATAVSLEGDPKFSLHIAEHQGVPLTTLLVNKPGPWRELSPTLGLVEDKLILSTSLEAARRVVETVEGGAPAAVSSVEGTPFFTFRMKSRPVRRMVRRHRDFLIQHAVEEGGKSEARAEKELDSLQKLLVLIDGVQYAAGFSEGRGDHRLIVRLSQMARTATAAD